MYQDRSEQGRPGLGSRNMVWAGRDRAEQDMAYGINIGQDGARGVRTVGIN